MNLRLCGTTMVVDTPQSPYLLPFLSTGLALLALPILSTTFKTTASSMGMRAMCLSVDIQRPCSCPKIQVEGNKSPGMASVPCVCGSLLSVPVLRAGRVEVFVSLKLTCPLVFGVTLALHSGVLEGTALTSPLNWPHLCRLLSPLLSKSHLWACVTSLRVLECSH